ncbi:MAG: phospho-sugar mutase [Cyclobacteriaceae bacterium]
MDIVEKSRASANAWLNDPVIDASTKSEVSDMLHHTDSKLLVDSFYKDLEFGTGGLRGIMGAGSNCVNRYTIGKATQGLANYLKRSFPAAPVKVAIAFDSRNRSKELAHVTASVFSANGIEVHIFEALRPTPLLSFAIRYLGCQSGVVITASHNPKEYNGYKAYWTDGAQLIPPHDEAVINEVNAITSFDMIKFKADEDKIFTISSELEDAYYKQVAAAVPSLEIIRKHNDIPIVFSGLHGTGSTMVPECLSRLGFTNCITVAEQAQPDGSFPTVASPNPEEQSAMQMALQLAKEKNAELVMATDPDADRVGIGIKDSKGDFFLLNGNQAFSLMIWFILRNLERNDRHYIAKTIVTTELVDEMAKYFGVTCYNTLTGFKYIAALINELEDTKTFIAAGEESYGYMVGDFVRDKDAVSACAFFAAMAAAAKDEKKTLFDWLVEIYQEHGFYKEGLVNVVRKGADGAREIKELMTQFRTSPPVSFNNEKVVRALDYQAQIEKDLISGTQKEIILPASDVLQFYTEKGTKISVRPSGTEPKIKFYISVSDKLSSPDEYELKNRELDFRIESIKKQLIT